MESTLTQVSASNGYYRKDNVRAMALRYEELKGTEKRIFDRALSSIGKGKWYGPELRNTEHIIGEPDIDKDLWDYKPSFGKLQLSVIADIIKAPKQSIKRVGIKQIPQARGTAYKWMACVMNGQTLPLEKR